MARKKPYSEVNENDVWMRPKGRMKYIKLRNGTSMCQNGLIVREKPDKQVLVVGKSRSTVFAGKDD